jgi:hypothetical protein
VDFDQARAGDQVVATITQKVRVSLDNEKAPSVEGASIADGTQVTARITAIDAQKRTVTLSFDNGTTETVSVRRDIDLSRHRTDEQLAFRVTEMTAIKIERLQ